MITTQNINGFIVANAKPVKLKRIPVLILDEPGINKKVYPKDVVRDAVNRWKLVIQRDPTRRYIFAKHPKDDDEEWLGIIAGVIDDLYIDEDKGVLYSDATILPTIWGHAIAWLLENGYTIGVSIRGDAKLEDTYHKLSNGKMVPVRKASYLSLDGYDFVVFPSYIVTQVTKENIKEQRQKFLPGEIDDEVDIVCSLTGICNCRNQIEKVKEQASPDKIITIDEIKKQIMNDVDKENIQEIQEDSFISNVISKENLTFNDNANNTIAFNDNQPIDRRSEEMVEKEKELIQAEIERLKLEKARRELELEKIQEQVKKAQLELEAVRNEFNEMLEKVKEQRAKAQAEEEYVKKLLEAKVELEKVQEQIQSKNDELKAQLEELEKVKEQINQLEAKKTELESSLKEIEAKKEELEKIQERASNVIVKCCGKTFDENNPPKLRVVPVDELVSNKEWGTIDHDVTRKLVYLAGDENVAKEVFGIIDPSEGWSGYKYPVYEHRKSSEDGYDVDLVLNLNGLRTALVFLQGRPGMALTRKEKKQLVQFLLKKYEALKEAGIIDEIPESLQNLAKSLKVLEQVRVKADDEIVDALIELGLEKGLIDFEPVEEQVEVEVDKELVLGNIALALAKALSGEPIKEQAGINEPPQFGSYEDGLDILWNLLADTEIANQLGLGSKEDLDNYIEGIVNSLTGGDIATGLKGISVIENALRGTGAVVIVVPLVIMKLEKMGGGNNQQPEQNQGGNEESTNTGGEEQTQTENTQPTQEQVSNESQITNTDNNTTITQIQEKAESKEEDVNKETFLAIKKLLEERLEGVSVSDESELVPVIEQVLNDYETTYEIEQELRLELAKKDALLKARELGVDIEKVQEKIASAESVDDVQAIMVELEESLKKDEEGKTEKVTEKAESGKGFAVIDEHISKQKDSFDELLDEI